MEDACDWMGCLEKLCKYMKQPTVIDVASAIEVEVTESEPPLLPSMPTSALAEFSNTEDGG